MPRGPAFLREPLAVEVLKVENVGQSLREQRGLANEDDRDGSESDEEQVESIYLNSNAMEGNGLKGNRKYKNPNESGSRMYKLLVTDGRG